MELVLTTMEQVEAALKNVLSDSGRSELRYEEPKEWLTNAEAMDFLGSSRATLQRLRVSGKLAFSKVNGSIYYKRTDVLDLLERNRRSK